MKNYTYRNKVYLDTLYILPELIVLVDDKIENLISVGVGIQEYNKLHKRFIKYHAYHYNR